MKKPRICYTRPSISALEIAYVTDAVTNGWGERCYGYITRFEEAFRGHVGSRFSIATSSCTGALHMGMAALGIGPGDEVILADTNWIASCAPIVHLGATPVFVDILPDTWCLDPASVEAAITNRTRAILAVHLYGNLADMERLMEIGRRHNIPVIEDAAEGLGSYWRNHHVGTMGCFGVFSFHGTKTLTTGEGGMLITNDEGLFEHVLTLSNHGRAREQMKQFWADRVGFKYKMSNLQAAIGLAQVERIQELVSRKQEILGIYRALLAGLQGVTLNSEPPGTRNGAWMPTVVFDRTLGVTREHLLAAFSAENIDARVFFYPLSGFPMFSPCRDNVHSWDIPSRAINLPSFHDITQAEQIRVADVICKVTPGSRA